MDVINTCAHWLIGLEFTVNNASLQSSTYREFLQKQQIMIGQLVGNYS
jgi:hypothetical protein